MTPYLNYECPVCKESVEVEYESPDHSVGIWGGVIPPEAPDACPEADCLVAYTPEQKRDIAAELNRQAEQWQPEGPDGEE